MPALDPIGAYVPEAELGRGAHGVVYRAHHRSDPDKPIALKVVENRGNLDRLMLEPALLSKLRHSCIVGIDDYFLQGDDLILALEFIEGSDLKTQLDEGRTFTQAEVRELLVQLLGALAHAHTRNIVHRDLKPANILVESANRNPVYARNRVSEEDDRPRYVLTDFGIGRAAEGIQFEKHVGGTYLFMAPEQLRGRPGPQSDLWALGVVAYRLVTGRFPFEGKTLPELSQQIFYATPASPSELAPGGVDPEMERLILRLLEKSLQERYATALEALRDLGFRGDPDSVLSMPSRPTATAVRVNVEKRLARAILWRRIVLAALALVHLVSGGIVSGLLFLLGAVAFLAGHTAVKPSRRYWGIGGGLFLFLTHTVVRFALPWLELTANLTVLAIAGWAALLNSWAAMLGSIGVLVFTMIGGAVIWLFFLIVVPVLIGYNFVAVRRLLRERIIRRAALVQKEGAEDFLKLLGDVVDRRFEDVELHLKYAEGLFASGGFVDAAAEATVLLEQDPYHFGGNLLLATALERLALYDECMDVCEDYLDVSGQCFEFRELREHCLRKRKAS